MMNTHLATIEKITAVKSHPNADRLDLVQVLGYTCVTQKDLYKEGDHIVYVKTDTILPDSEWAEGYKKYSPNRVKAVKLREVFSEGIIIPIENVKELLDSTNLKTDVTNNLNITKFVPPIPQDLNAKSSILPYQMPATDEERFENFEKEKLPFGDLVDVTWKVDGQSCSMGYNLEEDYFFITTRNQELKLDSVNNYIYCEKLHNIKSKLTDYCKKYNISLVLRGEIYGKGIQSTKYNPHSKLNVNIAFFDTYDLNARKHQRKGSLHYFVNVCDAIDLPLVPVLEENVILTQDLIDYYSTGVEKLNNNTFEGVVVKHSKGSFKVMNKFYDTKK